MMLTYVKECNHGVGLCFDISGIRISYGALKGLGAPLTAVAAFVAPHLAGTKAY